jgi:hypothetical protein
MKVVRKGVIPEDKKWFGTCSNCKSQVEAIGKELKVTSDQRDGTFGEAPCPICKHRMIFYPVTE